MPRNSRYQFRGNGRRGQDRLARKSIFFLSAEVFILGLLKTLAKAFFSGMDKTMNRAEIAGFFVAWMNRPSVTLRRHPRESARLRALIL
jgi:hypothetical protein